MSGASSARIPERCSSVLSWQAARSRRIASTVAIVGRGPPHVGLAVVAV